MGASKVGDAEEGQGCRIRSGFGFCGGAHLPAATPAPAVVLPTHTRTDDIVYGRKFGVALTLDVIQPAKPNGYGIVYMVSGGPGDPQAADPVDRASSAIQAIACLYPPTDFLNYGRPGEEV